MKQNTGMRFGARIFLRTGEKFSSIIARAQVCEKYGFDSVFIDDHLLYGTSEALAPEPFTTISAIAAHTKKIRIGIMVTDMVRRHPAIIAQSAATLSTIAPDRIFLGLGAGDPMNQAPYGFPTNNRYRKLREGFKVLKILWSSSFENPASFTGNFFSLKNAYLQTGNIATAPVPVYLAAFGEKMLQLTAQEADGWIPHCHTPETYNHDLSIIKKAGKETKRRLTSFLPSYYTLASASNQRDSANARVLGPARYFLALIPEALRKIDPSVHHPGRIWEKMTVPREQRETIRRIASTIPDASALKTVIHGSPSDCVEQIEEFRAAGCRELMLTFVSGEGLWSTKGLVPSIRFFAKKVMNRF